MPEYLYVIRCHEFTKIGIASNVRNRLKTLQTGNPYALELVDSFEFDDALRVEAILHKKYDYAWERGEWFKLTEEEFEKLIELCRNFDENRVELSDRVMALKLLESALSYCVEAGMIVDIYNADGKMIMEIHGAQYVDERIVAVEEKSEA